MPFAARPWVSMMVMPLMVLFNPSVTAVPEETEKVADGVDRMPLGRTTFEPAAEEYFAVGECDTARRRIVLASYSAQRSQVADASG